VVPTHVGMNPSLAVAGAWPMCGPPARRNGTVEFAVALVTLGMTPRMARGDENANYSCPSAGGA